MSTQTALPDYPFEMRPLAPAEGGGWLIAFPDLPGCISDGSTPEEAIANGRDALESWLATAEAFGDPIPQPGEFMLIAPRLPKSLRNRLTDLALAEGVSVPVLVTTLLAQNLGLPKTS